MRAILPKIIVVLVLLAAAVSFVWRLQFGVNLSDEALHVGIPLRFALGMRPFLDELSSVQTYGLVTWPLASLYMRWNGSTDAIVVFFRIVFACMWSVLALSYWFLTKRHADRRLATLAATAPLICIPSNIPSISYVSLGMFAFSFLALINLGLLGNRSRLRSAAIGWTTTLGTFAYPPAFPALLLLAFRCARNGFSYTHAIAAGLLVCGPALLVLGFSEIYHHSTALQYIQSGSEHAPFTWSRMVPLASPLVFILSAVAILIARRVSYGLVLPCAVVCTYLVSSPEVASYAILPNTLLILIPLLLVAEIPPYPRDLRTQTPLRSTLVASLLAYAGTCYFSDYPATCSVLWFGPLFGVLVLRIYQRLTPEQEPLAITFCALTLCLALLLTINGRYTWEEAPIQTHSARITSGPYAYLKTSPHRRTFLDEFERSRSTLITSQTSVVGWGEVAPSFLSLYYPTQYGLATAYPDRNEKRQVILAQHALSSPGTRMVGLRTSFSHQPLCNHLPLDQLLCAGKAPRAMNYDQHLVMSWWLLEKPATRYVALEEHTTNVDQ